MNKDLQIAKKTVQTEIQALKKLLGCFGNLSQFSKAVNLISKMRGKCLVVGVGKSNLVGQIISFFNSKSRNTEYRFLSE